MSAYKIIFPILLMVGFLAFSQKENQQEESFVSYVADPNTQDIEFYWKDDKGQILNSIGNLKKYVESQNKSLVFAMNGGMYLTDYSPQGLFIQNGKTLKALNTKDGNANFYLKPNGIFYITDNNMPVVCQTSEFVDNSKIKFATQSGPMLIINGEIHPTFKEGSTSLFVRNGVGILPDGKILFAMSESPVNFYDFARYFKNAGCKNALYLDGFVSRTYLPEKKWIQTDGDFGVMIGVTKPSK